MGSLISLNEYENELLEKVSSKLVKSTCQIFINEQQRYISIGSGVLIRIQERSFLVTAAHVLNDNNIGQLHLRVSNGFLALYSINKELKFTTDRLADVDLSILEFNSQLYKQCDFLELNDLDINHELNDSKNYFICGFPGTKTNYNPYHKKYQVQPFTFLTEPYSKPKGEAGLATDWSIFAKYPRKKLMKLPESTKTVGPEPYGISGCGIWCLKNSIISEGEEPLLHLVGIMIEINSSQEMLGTKIQIATELLRVEFNVESVPKGKIQINTTHNNR